MTPPEYIQALIAIENPSEAPPTNHPWSEISRLLVATPAADRSREFQRWISKSNGQGDAVIAALIEFQRVLQNPQPEQVGRVWSVYDLIIENFGEIPVLVGERSNALMVRGEGHLIVGPAGIGKTLLLFDFALRLALGEDILGYQTVSPLSVLILQAELPMQFVQARFLRLIEGYESGGNSDVQEAINRVHVLALDTPLNLSIPENQDRLAQRIDEVRADILIIDPFLPFFSGDENSNSEVRATLDAIKFKIAIGCNCAVLISDHLAKSDPGSGARARGAGAKIDWASLVINLSPHKTPPGENGQFVAAELTKVRYGWTPAEPILLHRDQRSLQHHIWIPEEMNLELVVQIVTEAGGEVASQNRMLELIETHYGVGGRMSRRILESAVSGSVILTGSGRNRAITYRLPEQDEDDRERSE